MKKKTRAIETKLLAAVMVAASALAANAAEVLKPQIGEPLADAAVTRAPDGIYYLTGTRAMNRRLVYDKNSKTAALGPWELSKRPDGGPDFMDNDGVKLWSSKDLVEWKEEGLVVDLLSFAKPHKYLGLHWYLPERSLREYPVRGTVAPRLQWVHGKPTLTLSNAGRDTRWLAADKPTGPYRESREFDKTDFRHRDAMSYGPGAASLFTDADGVVYQVRGPGYLEPLDAAGKDIAPGAGELLLAQVRGYPNAEWCAAQFDPHAASLFLHQGKYLLTWAAYTDIAGHKRDDTFVAVADSLRGPYSEPTLLIPGGGPATLFDGGERGLLAACSVDGAPVLVPLSFDGAKVNARALPALASVKSAAKPGPLKMFDYAAAKANGDFAQFFEATGQHRPIPVLDIPLSEISLAKDDDGVFYMTGTTASLREGERFDFQNNDGIHLWRSSDLRSWSHVGKVWDIERDGSAWAKQYRVPGDNPARADFARGVTAPEIHFIGGKSYVVYSMNGRGVGLLRADKPEGPYKDLGRLVGMGESPSLFAQDGKVHLLWGKGLQIAALDLDKGGLTTLPRDIFHRIVPYNGMFAYGTIDMWDVTAPAIFTAVPPKGEKARLYLTFSTITQCHGRASRDTAVAVGDALDGIFQGPVRMIPHGGQTSVVFAGDGKGYLAFSGADPSAVFRDQPGLLPLDWRHLANIHWPGKPLRDYVTIHGPWSESKPDFDFNIRDGHVLHAPDGKFYFSASVLHNTPFEKDLRYFRADDLFGPWEDMGHIYTMEQMRDDPNWPSIESDADKNWNKAIGWWEPTMSYGKGTYWISGWFGGHGWGKDVVWKKSIGALLRSSSGKPEGPYVFHTQISHDASGVEFDAEGHGYQRQGTAAIYRFTDDMKKPDPSWTRLDGKEIGGNGVLSLASEKGHILSEDCGTNFLADGDRYFFIGLDSHSTYDGRVFVASGDIRGPYRWLGILPFLGNNTLVRNKDGRWYVGPCQPSVGDAGFNFAHPMAERGAFFYEIKLDLDSDRPSVHPVFDIESLDDATYNN